MNTNLNILISTLDTGINNVANVILDIRKDVSYIVSHQYTDEKFKTIPNNLIRKDVLISQIKGKGVTKSRNNVIDLADANIGIFSDDDVSYTHAYIDTVINTFSNDKELDVALFKINTPEEYPEYKKYPKSKAKLIKLPFSVGTIEIAFRIDRLRNSNIRFDERFGAGQKLLIGSDESIFILDCIKYGLNTWFIPDYIVNHPFESTIKLLGKYDKRKVSVVGAYDARINGISAIPRAIKETIRLAPDLIKNNKNPLIYLYQRLSAVVFIFRTNKYL